MHTLIDRIHRSLKLHGFFGSLYSGVQPFLFLLPSYRNARTTQTNWGLEFDRRWGVDTCGIILPDKSEVIGKNWVYGTRYQGIDPISLEHALKALPISYKGFTFIDFGSGKGRAVLVASRFPFKKVIGVEYCPRLNSVARKNILRFPDSEKQCTDVEVVCTDAASYPIPEGDLLIFLFNPFGRAVMKELIRNIMHSLEEDPREALILYGNPVHGTLWADAGFWKENGTPQWLSIYRAPLSLYKNKKWAWSHVP